MIKLTYLGSGYLFWFQTVILCHSHKDYTTDHRETKVISVAFLKKQNKTILRLIESRLVCHEIQQERNHCINKYLSTPLKSSFDNTPSKYICSCSVLNVSVSAAHLT